MNHLVAILIFFTAASATPMLDSDKGKTVKEFHHECADTNDAISCMKFKVMQFLDQIFSKDSIQVTDNIGIVRNGEVSIPRSNPDYLDYIEDYLQTHDVVAKLPEESSLRISPRSNEIKLSVSYGEGKSAGEARKSKLKKILIPILVFVLLKAMTLIPLAIGVLGLKAWNALQLSFFSFVISVALAIFQLCKKIAADASTAQVAAHGPWDNYQAHYMARSDDEAQELAYSGHL